ncbi:MAG TPA: hypothetical protein VGP42_08990 [Stellaceae bacterium]|jgi:hypothetical protein|nr:hypothetical protein [Stellaceae bacterium]
MAQGGIGEESEKATEQQDTAEHRDEGKQYEEHIQSVTAVVTVVDRISTEHQADRKQRERHESFKSKREWLTIVALLIAAGVAAWGILWSHSDTRRAIREAHDSAEKQAGIFEGQLIAMNKANEDSSIALKSIQRAFIFVSKLEKVEFSGSIPRADGWKFTPIFDNSGTTPARDIQVAFITPKKSVRSYLSRLSPQADIFIDAPPDPEPIFSLPEKEKANVVINLGPLGPHNSDPFEEGAANIYKAMVSGINSGSQERFIAGAVIYNDIFSIKHVLKY